MTFVDSSKRYRCSSCLNPVRRDGTPMGMAEIGLVSALAQWVNADKLEGSCCAHKFAQA
jgi:hypothetical protein